MNICSNTSSCRIGRIFMAMAVCTLLIPSAHAAMNDRFSNIGSIANTRHNLTQSAAQPGLNGFAIAQYMDRYRNNYGEVCVYCHTPHGANQTATAPLWNRTIKVTNYQTYNELGTTSLTQDVSDTPGGASLACLSCHDGQTAIDSIINMPGSGMALLSQATTQDTAFLDAWTNPSGGMEAVLHAGLNSTNNVLGNGTGSDDMGCLTCHSPVGFLGTPPPEFPSFVLLDFRMFNLGTDLRDDHPIGVNYPTVNGPSTDWNSPVGVAGSSLYFDTISNGRMDKAEIRTYEGKVECATCHDPHGVPSAGPGTVFKPTFLRVDNAAGSAVCLTCHVK